MVSQLKKEWRKGKGHEKKREKNKKFPYANSLEPNKGPTHTKKGMCIKMDDLKIFKK